LSDINKEYDKLLDNADKISNKLTEENIEDINKIMEENAENNEDIKLVQSLPSNNGVEENIETEEGYNKKANIIIDPNTGENKIVSTEDDDETVDDTTFEDLVRQVENGEVDVNIDDSPITEEEMKKNVGILDENGNISIPDEDLHTLIDIVNRRMNKEEFNIYKALPREIQKQIDETIGIPTNQVGPVVVPNELRHARNSLAESLIDQFIMNTSIDRAKNDLNKEIEKVFEQSAQDIAEYSVDYVQERNAKYREYIETMEDEEKKAKLTETLDVIDSAYTLDPLKEFAKTCKIKKYDIENPKNYFRDFLNKYKNSTYNIYDIKLTLPILERKIVDDENYNNADVVAFLVCFCKYIQNFKVENVLEHSFMYYVIYNIVIADANVSDKTKDVSDKFMDNIKEVINNIKERNQFLK
jgi:hypothetical protein